MERRRARDVLGVGPAPDEWELRRAYRRALRRHHPDLGGDPAALDQVVTAYRALQRGPARRRAPATVVFGRRPTRRRQLGGQAGRLLRRARRVPAAVRERVSPAWRRPVFEEVGRCRPRP